MQEVFEKIIENLEERSKEYNSGVRLHGKPEEMLTCDAIEIVKQAAEGMSEFKTCDRCKYDSRGICQYFHIDLP